MRPSEESEGRNLSQGEGCTTRLALTAKALERFFILFEEKRLQRWMGFLSVSTGAVLWP